MSEWIDSTDMRRYKCTVNTVAASREGFFNFHASTQFEFFHKHGYLFNLKK